MGKGMAVLMNHHKWEIAKSTKSKTQKTQFAFSLVSLIVKTAVMVSIVDAQREILLDPIGTNVWSGQVPQSTNSAAVTWALAKQLYGRNGPYIWVPLALLFGMVPTFFQWLIYKVLPFFFFSNLNEAH